MQKLTKLQPRLTTLKTVNVGSMAAGTLRLSGGAAVKRRREFLGSNPLCVACDKQGATSVSTVPDHVVPLWAGGSDDLEANGQPLCEQCHALKTACEARMRSAGGWLTTACECGQH